jgi:hypothetical protein
MFGPWFSGPALSQINQHRAEIMRQRRVTKCREISEAYELTPQERAVIEAYVDRRNGIAPSPCSKSPKKRAERVSAGHPDLGTGAVLLMNARTRFSQFSA